MELGGVWTDVGGDTSYQDTAAPAVEVSKLSLDAADGDSATFVALVFNYDIMRQEREYRVRARSSVGNSEPSGLAGARTGYAEPRVGAQRRRRRQAPSA